MACRPTAGTTYHVLIFTLGSTPSAAGATPDEAGLGVICLDARYAARARHGTTLQALAPAPDAWPKIAREIARGLPSAALDRETAISRVLAAGEAVEVRWSGTWQIEAADVDELIRTLAPRMAAPADRQGRAS